MGTEGTPGTEPLPRPADTTPDGHRRQVLSWWIRGTWCAGALVLAAGTALFAEEVTLPVLVLWGRLLVGPHIALAACLTVLALWTVSGILAVVRLGEPFVETPVLLRRILRRTVRTVTAVATALTVPVLGLAAFLAATELPLAAHVLVPQSPDGCRLYAVVRPAYDGTDTDFYFLPRGHVVAVDSGRTWPTNGDGPSDPVVSLPWSLEWDGDSATLRRAAEEPVDATPLTCPAP